MTRSMLVRSLATVGFALVASSCSDDKVGSFTLSLSDAALTLNQSVKDTVLISLTRTDYSKPVNLTLSGVPVGVAASFAPGTVPSPGENSLLILTASGTAAVGTATVTVKANGEGVTERSTTFELTVGVTGTYAISTGGVSATAAQGGGTSVTLLLNRTGGHADNVALSVTGAPAGVTASISPTSTNSAGATLIVTATGGAAVATTALTITGVAAGLANQTAMVDLNIIAPPSTASLTMPFCSNRIPLWFAYQNEGFGWQTLSPTGSTFTFQATAKVGVAYTVQLSTRTEVHTLYMGRDELAGWSDRNCAGPKTLTGSIVGMAAGQSTRINLGASSTTVAQAAPAFTLNNVADRVLDLAATRGVITTFSDGFQLIAPDMLFLRRAQNPATNTSFGNLDFTGVEAFTPASNAITVGNALGGDAFYVGTTLWTDTDTYLPIQSADQVSAAFSVFSAPGAKMIAGDVHELYLEANQPGTSTFLTGRTVSAYFGAVTDHTETMLAALSAPTLSMLSTAPYYRILGQLPVQADYPTATRFLYQQDPGNKRVVVWVSAAYLGSTPVSTWNVAVPDYSGVGGFNTSWMITNTTNLLWQVDSFSGPVAIYFGSVPSAGDVVKAAYRVHLSSPSLRAAEVRDLRSARQYLRR
jgi:hypothetical protein